MTFQSSVAFDQGYALPGEIVFDGPRRSEPCQIDPNATMANVVVGRMFSESVSTGLAVPGSGGAVIAQGTNRLLGILAMPKNYALQGTSAGTLTPTLLVAPGTIGEFVSMTAGIGVVLGNAAAPGDNIEYNLTTGVLQAVRSATVPDAGFGIVPGASVARVLTTDAGLSVVQLNGLL